MQNPFKKLFSIRRSKATEHPSAPNQSYYFLGMPKAGIHVDENTALALSAVFACVAVIVKGLASLPFRVHMSDGDKRILLDDDPIDQLIARRPNEEITANIFWGSILVHLLLWQNAYAEIERNRMGEPIAIWLLTPDRVEPKRDSRRRLYYEVRQDNGQTVNIRPANILHFRGFLTYDGERGMPLITLARESIATALAGEQYAGTFFGNGAMPGSVVTSDGTTQIEPEGIKKMLDSLRNMHGGPGKKHKVEFLDPGMDIKPLSVNPVEAQALESRKFMVEEVARWFGVPLHKIGHLDRATNNNIEEQGIDFTVDTLQPWGKVLTSEVDAKLLTGGKYSRINYKARLQTDIKARGEYYRLMFNTGSYSPNDILRLEDENPVEGGDVRFIPVNMIPLLEAAKLTADSRNNPSGSIGTE